MVSTIETLGVTINLPVFKMDISEHQQVLNQAKEAIFEQYAANPVAMESNVKAWYVTDWMSHKENPKFQPLIDLVLDSVKFISKGYFKQELDFYCFNCWGMLYNEGDYTLRHCHYPSDFAAVVYLDVEEGASSLQFDNLTITPTTGSLVIFPAHLYHEVPKTNAKRMVVAMNIDKKY